jgi:hypothetical protein
MVFTVKNYRAVTATTTAQLTVYPGQYQFIFPDLAKLSAGDLAIWKKHMTEESSITNLSEFLSAFKEKLLTFQKDIDADPTKIRNFREVLPFGGWASRDDRQDLIYAPCKLVSKSTSMLAYHLDSFRRSTQSAKDQAEKESKARADAALKF